jgi:hypothetical protein
MTGARGTFLDESAVIGTSLLNCDAVQFLGEVMLVARLGPGCYAYRPEHLGINVTLRQLTDVRGANLG